MSTSRTSLSYSYGLYSYGWMKVDLSNLAIKSFIIRMRKKSFSAAMIKVGSPIQLLPIKLWPIQLWPIQLWPI